MPLVKIERAKPTYRTPHRIAEDKKEDPRPVSMVGAGQGGMLTSFVHGIGATNGR